MSLKGLEPGARAGCSLPRRLERRRWRRTVAHRSWRRQHGLAAVAKPSARFRKLTRATFIIRRGWRSRRDLGGMAERAHATGEGSPSPLQLLSTTGRRRVNNPKSRSNAESGGVIAQAPTSYRGLLHINSQHMSL